MGQINSGNRFPACDYKELTICLEGIKVFISCTVYIYIFENSNKLFTSISRKNSV